MLKALRDPVPEFRMVVRSHFLLKREEIFKQLDVSSAALVVPDNAYCCVSRHSISFAFLFFF